VFTGVLGEISGKVAGNLCRCSGPFPGILPNRGWTLCSARQGANPVRHIRVFITHRFRCNAAIAPLNVPASWPSMSRTKPRAGFPFPRRKTKHRFVRLVALSKTAGGALADLCQRLAIRSNSFARTCFGGCQHREMPFSITSSPGASWDEGFGPKFFLSPSNS
jgi:hypothetical protein